jgi:hypothetical protein
MERVHRAGEGDIGPIKLYRPHIDLNASIRLSVRAQQAGVSAENGGSLTRFPHNQIRDAAGRVSARARGGSIRIVEPYEGVRIGISPDADHLIAPHAPVTVGQHRNGSGAQVEWIPTFVKYDEIVAAPVHL